MQKLKVFSASPLSVPSTVIVAVGSWFTFLCRISDYRMVFVFSPRRCSGFRKTALWRVCIGTQVDGTEIQLGRNKTLLFTPLFFNILGPLHS